MLEENGNENAWYYASLPPDDFALATICSCGFIKLNINIARLKKEKTIRE